MKTSRSRHGVRADNKTQTTVSLSKTVLEAAKEAAAREHRSLSNWLEHLLILKAEEMKRLRQEAEDSKN